MAEGTPNSASSLPYHEPDIVTVLIQASFLLLLNAVNVALDRTLYCGLLGQVLIGIAWGTPGAKWLSMSVQETAVQFGYLGLILLVYEGGLHTSFHSLKANLVLSCCVALTGIAVPIGLSYTLQALLDATPVQAFAAGAALCSTSLGTTFTVLKSSRLSSSRLGVVLTSAAIMDDVVGLVMVQVISNLGAADFSWVTVVRPVLVSAAFAIVSPLACLLVVKPVTYSLNRHREAHPSAGINRLLQKRSAAFVIHTLILIGVVAGATYAGTSNLFASYIVGASISWWDSEVPHVDTAKKPSAGRKVKKKQNVASTTEASATASNTDVDSPDGGLQMAHSKTSSGDDLGEASGGGAVYAHYYAPAVSKILQPLFFASIGFSIPITKMFRGSIVWRGIIYTVLMAFAKLVCGLWLVRFPESPGSGKSKARGLLSKLHLPAHFWSKSSPTNTAGAPTSATTTVDANADAQSPSNPRSSPSLSKPFSLQPSLILALAMCARGEIGFLISGVAEANGVFSASDQTSEQPSDIFLVVSWAIVVCTLVGPLGVGLSVRRVKKLQERKKRLQEGTGREVLGVWGVE